MTCADHNNRSPSERPIDSDSGSRDPEDGVTPAGAVAQSGRAEQSHGRRHHQNDGGDAASVMARLSMASGKSEPSEKTKRLLFGSASQCGFPHCREPVVLRFGEFMSINAEVAHIRSDKRSTCPGDPARWRRVRDAPD